jgi:hypothetical protein
MPTAQQRIATTGIEELLRNYGAPSDLADWRARLMPEDKLLDIARRVAFITFEPMPKYDRLERYHLVNHGPSCDGSAKPKFEAGEFLAPPSSLRKAWSKMVAAADRSLASWGDLAAYFTRPAVVVRFHVATCPTCLATVHRYSALVTVYWAGRPLSREFALE